MYNEIFVYKYMYLTFIIILLCNRFDWWTFGRMK